MHSILYETSRSDKLLDWYDRHARIMPWRVPPEAKRKGVLPDAYKVWLSEIMLQQTQINTAVPYYNRWVKIYPTLSHVAKAKSSKLLPTPLTGKV